MRRAVVIASVLALGGCDYLFQLDHVPPLVPPDASTIDVAAGCFSTDDGDEDADGVSNGCDKCPLVAGDQTDRDGDGVGDLCDANPMMALERIAFFHPMKSLNRAEWVITGEHAEGWQTSSVDGIQQPGQGNNDFVRTYMRTLRSFDQPYIQVRISGAKPDDDALDRSAAAAYAIIGDDALGGLPDGFLCGLEFPDASAPTNPSAFSELANSPQVTKVGVQEPAPPVLITIATLQSGATRDMAITPACTVRPGVAAEVPVPVAGTITPRAIKVGMWTQNTAATFVALFVTERIP